MGCCASSGFTREEINGVCPDCGGETVNGCAYECCDYAAVDCETCGYAPCNEGC